MVLIVKVEKGVRNVKYYTVIRCIYSLLTYSMVQSPS